MIGMPTTDDVLDGLFFMMKHIYDATYKPGLSAVFQFYLEDKNEIYKYYISVQNDQADYAKGEHENPDVKIFTPANLWIDITSENRNPFIAYLKKEFRVEGNSKLMPVLGKAFRKTYTNKDLPELGPEIDEHEKLTLWPAIKTYLFTTLSDFIYRQQIFGRPSRKQGWVKPKDVIVLNGSPRQGRAYTYFYLEKFISGMEKAGANVELINLADKKQFEQTEACRGCYACWKGKRTNVCVIKDSYTELLDRVESAKLVVYATPLYVDTVSAVLKEFMDRHFVYLTPYMNQYKKMTRHPMHDKEDKYFALFSVCGFPEIEQFKPLVNMFQAHARNSHKPLLATILKPSSEGTYLNPFCWPYIPKIMNSIEEAGRLMIEEGYVPPRILRDISRDYVKSKLWWTGPNLYWKLKYAGTKKPWVFLMSHNNYGMGQKKTQNIVSEASSIDADSIINDAMKLKPVILKEIKVERKLDKTSCV